MEENRGNAAAETPDGWSLLTWIATAILAYLVVSGALIYWLQFSAYSQFSVLVHTATGVIAFAPVSWFVWRHRQRRVDDVTGMPRTVVGFSIPLLVLCLGSGLVITLQAALDTVVSPAAWLVHQVTALFFALVFAAHVIPVLLRFARPNPTPRRLARPRFLLVALLVVALPLVITQVLSGGPAPVDAYQPFPDEYALPYGADKPFAPSRAQLAGKPDGSAALNPQAIPNAATCGQAGCHGEVYREWTPSAHGFAAEDTLFLSVQELLAQQDGSAETRLCAGCHDPVALLAGTRDGGSIAGDALVVGEGVSCVGCHGIVSTDTEGNGGYTLQVPEEYLFADATQGGAAFANAFLIRSYPWQHRETYGPDLHEASEFCAACHKQTPGPAADTGVGLAQEQNEYDSWRNGHWFNEEDPEATLHCRDCHMPLVASADPAGDGQHRSHRYLGSNMYMPVALGIPGGNEQAALTARWLRGELEIPEIADRWADGPVVTVEIVAPESVNAGELVNLTLVLHNNKTGHDFPAGPLDILASWVELEVVDNLGRTVLHLGRPDGDAPVTDAPIVYKADWYDKRGLPVDRHEIWEAVGSSYKRSLGSGDAEIVDVPFRCPSVARPRISQSFSEQGPGERKSDVVMSIDNEAVTTLTVKARVLYRKVTPEFLARTMDIDAAVAVPTLVLSESSQEIHVLQD